MASCVGGRPHRLNSGTKISLKYFLFVVRTTIAFLGSSTVTLYISSGYGRFRMRHSILFRVIRFVRMGYKNGNKKNVLLIELIKFHFL